MIVEASLLVTALLFGGMTFYSFAFAPYLFSVLPVDQVRTLIRKAFPHFYLFVLAASIVATVLCFFIDVTSAVIMAGIAVTVVYARQGLMPSINRATDEGETGRFKKLHMFSVIITLVHIAASAYVIVRLADFS